MPRLEAKMYTFVLGFAEFGSVLSAKHRSCYRRIEILLRGARLAYWIESDSILMLLHKSDLRRHDAYAPLTRRS